MSQATTTVPTLLWCNWFCGARCKMMQANFICLSPTAAPSPFLCLCAVLSLRLLTLKLVSNGEEPHQSLFRTTGVEGLVWEYSHLYLWVMVVRIRELGGKCGVPSNLLRGWWGTHQTVQILKAEGIQLCWCVFIFELQCTARYKPAYFQSLSGNYRNQTLGEPVSFPKDKTMCCSCYFYQLLCTVGVGKSYNHTEFQTPYQTLHEDRCVLKAHGLLGNKLGLKKAGSTWFWQKMKV